MDVLEFQNNNPAYQDFLGRKLWTTIPVGFDIDQTALPDWLAPFQRDLVRFGLSRGRAAIFADTGLGKTRVQISWARQVHAHSGGNVLILAPLAVAQQTIREGAGVGVTVHLCRSQTDVKAGLNITNYEMLSHFDPAAFTGVVLDESSIIKHETSATRNAIIAAFGQTPYRLACTATPAPNDHTEIGNHAEFLGIMTRTEMLSTFFVHDGGKTSDWRLKKHAELEFWAWVSSWAAAIRKPSDFGYEDGAYLLPPLNIKRHKLDNEQEPEAGMLFAVAARGLNDQRAVKRNTLELRCNEIYRLVNDEAKEYNFRNEQGGIDTGTGSEAIGEERVHTPVPLAESGQVEAHARAAGEGERSAAAGLQGERGGQGGNKGQGQRLANEEPGTTEDPKTQEIWDHSGTVQSSDGTAERSMRDLRLLGSEQAELLPSGGPLPRRGARSRSAVHELQHGAGEISGRPGKTSEGSVISRGDHWVIWCELNAEQELLEKLFAGDCASIHGTTPSEEKIRLHEAWVSGEKKILITKASLFGFGMNWQHCARMAFVSVTHSYEQFYQAVRRCYRFGQARPVEVHVVFADGEQLIVENIQRKEKDAALMAQQMVASMKFDRSLKTSGRDTEAYDPQVEMTLPKWLRSAV